MLTRAPSPLQLLLCELWHAEERIVSSVVQCPRVPLCTPRPASPRRSREAASRTASGSTARAPLMTQLAPPPSSRRTPACARWSSTSAPSLSSRASTQCSSQTRQVSSPSQAPRLPPATATPSTKRPTDTRAPQIFRKRAAAGRSVGIAHRTKRDRAGWADRRSAVRRLAGGGCGRSGRGAQYRHSARGSDRGGIARDGGARPARSSGSGSYAQRGGRPTMAMPSWRRGSSGCSNLRWG